MKWIGYDIALPISGAVLAPAWFLLTARVCSNISFKPEKGNTFVDLLRDNYD